MNMSHESHPFYSFKEHSAAVKAVSWCPWQSNILGNFSWKTVDSQFCSIIKVIVFIKATGGGTADGKIKIWNIYNVHVVHDVDAKSQISSLLWSKDFKEIISSHGYSLNQLTVWRYPDMNKICDLTGHTGRVLMMSMSPDQETVASAGADETLRLWKCFGLNEKQRKAKRIQNIADMKSASYSGFSNCIR